MFIEGLIAYVPSVPFFICMYVQREMWLGIGEYGEIGYQRAIDLLRYCLTYAMDSVMSRGGDNENILYAFNDIGFDDSELEYLGYGYLLESEEEDE